jgi:hypothetical protein
MSARDKIAQLVIPWIPGTYAAYDDDGFTRAERWVDSLHVGGIIVSVGSPLDVAAKLNRLQERSILPLLVGSDFEGGTSLRLNGGTLFPPNMGVGATGSDSAAYDIGRITALEGRAVGVHLAFAPVADVNNNPANPIINTRAFGEDPVEVGRFVAAEVRGLQDHGMLATAKHFPGHGDTGTDSHLALPVITSSWSRLDSVELVPFRAAIAAGVDVVMSAHIALPGIDFGQLRPGTVAPNVLTGILRDSLGFKGLIVTDALNMAGVVHSLPRERAPLTLVTYGEEDNRMVGVALALELRAQGFPVTLARLWPASGSASYDSVAATLRRNPTAVFATADRPVAGRGTIGLPAALRALIAGTARERPTVLVSLGNPYVISGLPEVGSYLIAWRSNAVTERAVAQALAGAASITGRLPIALPPAYARGRGLQRHVP